MRVLEARKVRRFVVELDDGAVLPDALEAALGAARVRRATLRGAGGLHSVELALGDDGAPRQFDGALELVAFEGTFDAQAGGGVEARVVVARDTDAGLQVLAGRLLEAVAREGTLDVEALEDLEEVRGVTAVERSAEARRERRAPTAESPWAAVAEASHDTAEVSRAPASRRRARPDKPLPPLIRPDPIPERARVSGEALLAEDIPERGDYVEHRQFGLCRVDGEDAHGGLIIRLPGGRRKTINLDYLEVLAPRTGSEGRVFPVRPRRR